IYDNHARDTMTCVEVTLDLCQYKPTPGGADPAALSTADKINVGRNIHLQTPDRWAGRALLIVRQALPADYPGPLVLKTRDARVQTYAYAHEVAAAGQATPAHPLNVANAPLGATPLKL